VQKVNRSYFCGKGVGFQCGVCYDSVPSHTMLTLGKYLMRKDPLELMRKDPPEILTGTGKFPKMNDNMLLCHLHSRIR
jgi:hypothetical protein